MNKIFTKVFFTLLFNLKYTYTKVVLNITYFTSISFTNFYKYIFIFDIYCPYVNA